MGECGWTKRVERGLELWGLKWAKKRGNKDGHSELETGKRGGGKGGNRLGAVALWGLRLEARGLGLWDCGTGAVGNATKCFATQ